MTKPKLVHKLAAEGLEDAARIMEHIATKAQAADLRAADALDLARQAGETSQSVRHILDAAKWTPEAPEAAKYQRAHEKARVALIAWANKHDPPQPDPRAGIHYPDWPAPERWTVVQQGTPWAFARVRCEDCGKVSAMRSGGGPRSHEPDCAWLQASARCAGRRAARLRHPREAHETHYTGKRAGLAAFWLLGYDEVARELPNTEPAH